ncbi:MAG: protein translocase subunit SecF [Acidobacteriota bacterium]|nr:protein translocase subunit SecF [Acidobacteriota bacterium]
MIEIFKSANYDFLGKKWFFIALSWVLILAGLVSVLYRSFDGKDHTNAFNMGVDFAGGTLATVKFRSAPDSNTLRQALEKQGVEGSKIIIQPVTDEIGQAPKNEILVRLPNEVKVERQQGQSETAAKALNDADIGKQKILAAISSFDDPSTNGKVDVNKIGSDKLKSELIEKAKLDQQSAEEAARAIVDYREKTRAGLIGDISEVKNINGVPPQIAESLGKDFFAGFASVKSAEAVSPQVGADLRNSAIVVTLVSCIAMLAFVAFRFKSWGFGIGAVIAVFHDVLVTLGIFSIMQWEINLTVVAALLTLVGYSMNDTIVIFDRIREMMRTKRREGLEKLSNDAINQTLSRTIITSGLTFLTVCAMLVFGGEVLKSFSWCLFIGILIGTYSSIYIASPFMLLWESWRATARTEKTVGQSRVASSVPGDNDSLTATSAGVTPQMLAAAGISTSPRKLRKKGK